MKRQTEEEWTKIKEADMQKAKMEVEMITREVTMIDKAEKKEEETVVIWKDRKYNLFKKKTN